MGCVPSQIAHLLSGNRKLNEEWLIKFCDALGITLADLEPQVSPEEHAELYRKLRYILTKSDRAENVLKATIEAAYKELKNR